MQPSDLILSPDLTAEEAQNFLRQWGFEDPAAADANLQRLAEHPGMRDRLAQWLPSLLDHLSQAADPDLALSQLEAFLEACQC